MIKKYIALFLLGVSLCGLAYAQTVGDVDTSEMTCTNLSYDLKLRSKDSYTNSEVTKLQEFLLDVGLLDADPSGYFGAATQKAVKSFQKQNNLLASGFVGPVTRKAIKNKSCNQTTTQTKNSSKTSDEANTYKYDNYYPKDNSYSSNLLKEMKISEPEWSIAENDKGTISVSLSNIPNDSTIGSYSIRFQCAGVKLPRNGGDLCGTKESLKNLNIGSYSASFPYELTTSASYYRGVSVELTALSSSGVVLGKATKTTYYKKGTYKGVMNDVVFIESSTMTMEEAYTDCSKKIKENTDATIMCTWNGTKLLSAKPQPKASYVFTKNGVVVQQESSIIMSAAYTDCMQRIKSDSKADYVCTWDGKTFYSVQAPVEKEPGPKTNAMSCKTRGVQGLSEGQLACYGVWDYGDEFGNDQDMCQSSNYITGITGCIVSTSICSSGKAKATKHVKPTSLSMSSSEIATYASNLNASKAAIKTQLPGLWEYTCVSQSSIDNESAAKQTEFEKISRFTSTGAELHVIGVYEAGSDHSFCHSTTGKVSVTVKNTGKPIILAVGSYEPVVWNIVLEQGAQLERVILSGYGVQKVTGISSSVPVSSYTYYSLDNVKKGTETGAGFFYDMRDPNSGVYYDWASQPGTCPKSAAVPVESRALLLGSSNYFYAYEAGGEGYSKLITKLKDITGVRPTSFQGAYQKTSFTVSSDSPAPVPAKENQDYYSQNSSFQAISVASIGSNSQVLGASTMCVNLTRNFHRGDESQDTKTLQTFLISNEYLDSDVSGFYGDKTVEAVKRYQRNKGLPETGMVYEFTRESIKRDSCN